MAPSLAVRGSSGAAPQKFTRSRVRNDLPCLLCSILLAVSLAGCVSYAPAPKPLSQTAERFSARSASLSTVVQTCQRLAPTASCDPGKPDRLMLFAMLVDKNPDVSSARAHLRSVEAAAAAARTSAGATLTLATEYAKASSDPSPWLFGAALDIPLDTGGRRTARVASA
ncbi:MAG: TolC family protein, partial [Micrococcales bacterium]